MSVSRLATAGSQGIEKFGNRSNNTFLCVILTFAGETGQTMSEKNKLYKYDDNYCTRESAFITFASDYGSHLKMYFEVY